jgi:hypothetical protein
MGTGPFGEPGGDAQDVQRGGDEQMQEAGLGEPPVAGPAQVPQADALRERSLDAGSGGVAFLELICSSACSRLLERLVQWPWSDGKRARVWKRRTAVVLDSGDSRQSQSGC